MLDALCFLLSAVPDVHVVDDTAGGPTEYATIQAAIDAAQSGDTILVLPGVYGPFDVDGKGLSIVGHAEEGGPPPRVFAGFAERTEVRNLAADQQVFVRGLELDSDLAVESCDGPVLLEDLDAGGRVIATDCADLVLVRSAFRASYGAGIEAVDSTLHGWELVVEGADGADGIRLTRSFLFLSGSTVRGGHGLPGADGSIVFPLCGDGGDGGDGIQLVDSVCRALDCEFDGGSGGIGGFAKIGPPCSPGSHGLDVDGPGLLPLPGVGHDFEVSSPGFEGGLVTARASGAAGELLYGLFSLSQDPVFVLAGNGTLSIDLSTVALFLGVLDGGGEFEADYTVGDLAPGLEVAHLVAQGLFVDVDGPDYNGAISAVELMDRDVLLVDCNGNGIDDAEDIASGFSQDLSENGQPDECDVTLVVPDQYPNIQAAVDAAADKDIVLVRDGIYSGTGNTGVELRGKDIVVRSENGPAQTRIDGESPIFFLRDGEPPTARVQGFTIADSTGGQSPIQVFDSSGVVADCVFDSNAITGGWGGAISVFIGGLAAPSTVRVEDCIFTGNSGTGDGGAIYANAFLQSALSLEVSGCQFRENRASQTSGGGGAIFADGCALDLRNSALVFNEGLYGSAIRVSATHFLDDVDVSIVGCTFFGNSAAAGGSPALNIGLTDGPTNSLAIRSSILWGSLVGGQPASEAAFWPHGPTAQISWTTLEDGLAGVSGPANDGGGLSTLYPRFVDRHAGDVHLLPGSPCIDAGDPAFLPLAGETDFDGEPRLLGAFVDQGADEVP